MTVEYYDCDAEILADSKGMENIFIEAAKASGATVLGTNFHAFEPQGVSGFVVIAESHFSVHAWPEHDYAAVDIFTCGDTIDFENAVDTLREGMKAGNVVISGVMNRGIISNNGIERMVPVYEDRTHMYALSWEKRFEDTNAWGLLSSVDIYNCDPEIIRNADKIKEFVKELCKRVKMNRYGDCEVVHFGEDERVAGFSMTQLIETSLISGHFANESNTTYLDVFSCKFYDPREVAEFAISFFEGAHYRLQVALRR
ncbi:MAG: adenosylmethionine decarboxylase [Lentisphaerae bacterium]|nr:adenosylmethionine decarboxylase [Lentisphaerota bacterium]MCP4101307.1 adenosylmethionine decarboxylase [Lentisphaerota bacterium]